mgnify:CR=1 FL=1
MKARQQTQPQPDPHVVTLFDVEYFVYWEHLNIGASFFIPTTATPKQTLEVLKPVAKAMDMLLEARARREYGRYGVRVWRVG